MRNFGKRVIAFWICSYFYKWVWVKPTINS